MPASAATAFAAGAAMLVLLSGLAFWPGYLSRLPGPLDAYNHLHAAVGLAWLGLLLVQPLLMRRRQPALHWRYMAGTALPLVDPVLGRVLGLYVVELPQFWHYQLVTFGIEFGVLALLAGTLEPGSAARRGFTAFAAAYAGIFALWFFVPRSAAWTAFAQWFRTLPLTG